MKRFIILSILALTMVGCKKADDSYELIKGHTFASSRSAKIELTFKKDMTIIYSWKNTFDEKTNKRSDLSYELLTDTTFVMYAGKNHEEWGNGAYHRGKTPFITADNFKGDTLYLIR